MTEVLTREKKAAWTAWRSAYKSGTGRKILRQAGRILLGAAPGFALAFSDICGVSAGAWAAYGMAAASCGLVTYPVSLGIAAAFLMRMLWGLTTRWELLIGVVLVLLSPHVLRQRNGAFPLIATSLALLPGAIIGVWQGSAATLLFGIGTILLGTLSAPVMRRAIESIRGGRSFETLESRLSVGYLLLMLLCGGARMMLPYINLGVTAAGLMTMAAAVYLGVCPGCVMGLMAGVTLALQGLPLSVTVALSLGGFLAGMGQMTGRRMVPCVLFALGTGGMLAYTGTIAWGALGAAAAAPLIMGVLPREADEFLRQQTRRFHPLPDAPGDAYAAYALRRWEKTVGDMARAVPSPVGLGEKRTPQWWEEHLCASCPERASCGCMNTELGQSRAEYIWKAHEASDEVWAQRLESLRGLGCARLYQLMDSMNLLRAENADEQRIIRRACQQRDMLVTHLTALSGSARHLAALSSGESWWDEQYARKLRHALAEEEAMARLSFVRQVDGHLQVAYELHGAGSADEQAAQLCGITSRCLGKPMTIAERERAHVRLTEMPLMMVEAGAASRCIAGADICGDTFSLGQLQDGRFVAALSDGMGHGNQAALESRQAVELLRMCLDAGYDRAQTLTAVNGMMLLAGQGERFTTVDLFLLDLWTGKASLDKLGAAGSYLMQAEGLSLLGGDALPLGILENVESGEKLMQLHQGDTLILLSDGVEDAYENRQAMEETIRDALTLETAQDAANAILTGAPSGDTAPADDQTVLVLRLIRARADAKIEEMYQ